MGDAADGMLEVMLQELNAAPQKISAGTRYAVRRYLIVILLVYLLVSPSAIMHPGAKPKQGSHEFVRARFASTRKFRTIRRADGRAVIKGFRINVVFAGVDRIARCLDEQPRHFADPAPQSW